MSLKQQLKEFITQRGSASNAEIYQLCFDGGYKPSNAERRLRELTNETPEIKPIKIDGVIRGYRYEAGQVRQAVVTPSQTAGQVYMPTLF